MQYNLTTTVPTDYETTVTATRAALTEQGFGVLTEIDVKATLKAKLDVDVPAQVILGACRPPLAHQALQTDPAIATLLPCNVVVRETDTGCVVDAIDPIAMMSIADKRGELHDIASDASNRIRTALATLGQVA
jgi:uncharacterized protein (DUF302 family)